MTTGFDELNWAPPLSPRAHPSWTACTLEVSLPVVASTDVVRKRIPSHQDDIALDGFARAVGVVADLGLGPRVLETDADKQTVYTTRLHGLRNATIARLKSGVLDEALAAHRTIMTSGAQLPLRTVQDRLGRLESRMHALGIERRGDGDDVYAVTGDILTALVGGPAPVFGWGDGNIGNLWIATDGSVSFTGGTRAGAMDPLQNIGSLIAELSPFMAEPEDVFVAMWGRLDPQLFARAQLYAVLDDLAAAYSAWIYDHTLGTNGVEYATFASMRLRRALRAVRAPEFADILARAA